MVETDWREILSYSQRELGKADKEKLCESLSWMEADDIELNFSDLKTLFRLAQDILKYKNEQVNNLMGQLETAQRKSKSKSKGTYIESPTRSGDSVIETIAHQEEVIKANKEILEQLYADIAELQSQKLKLEEDQHLDRESESSRDALSEMDAIAQLENEVIMKNRHIRKLLSDVKILEEQGTKLKEKVTVLKDKLTEATELIENLTEQLFTINNESMRMKDILGKSEKEKAELTVEMAALRKEILAKDSSKDHMYEEIKVKVQHWKSMAKSKKAELDALFLENTKLKEDIIRVSKSSTSPKKARSSLQEESKIKELQEKLAEASNKILESANVIESLNAENKQLKSALEETPDISLSDLKNESDDGKERKLINKLKRKVKLLSVSLQAAEEMIAVREKELTEIASKLQLLRSEEGVNALLEGLKNKKRKLKLKDEGIRTLVQEVNHLHQVVSDLQLENETFRQKLNIPPDQRISTTGIMKKYREIENKNAQLTKDVSKIENKYVTSELENHKLRKSILKFQKLLLEMGCDQSSINEIYNSDDNDDAMPRDGGGEGSAMLSKEMRKSKSQQISETEWTKRDEDFQRIVEENEGLRKGLQEMLNFLKDNSTTSSGILSLECPSLDAILHSMEARHAAGWFAPHMATVMELRAALGGKDALLSALHEARKETFDVMQKLTTETQKSQELQQKLCEMESKCEPNQIVGPNSPNENFSIGEFGTWMSDQETVNTDFFDKDQIDSLINKGNFIYENQLKLGLVYFHEKFKVLFEKMSSFTVQTADEQNKWSIKEEQYKAEIENLKAQIMCNDEDDTSELSPGLLNIPNKEFLQRKCSYLEESYKYIRTLNENIKNEYLESKRSYLVMSSEYESQIQKLILAVANLTDKLHSSISLELFWQQNDALNDINIKYRKLLDNSLNKTVNFERLYDRLDMDKRDIISTLRLQSKHSGAEADDTAIKTMLSNIEHSVLTKQLQQVCSEFENKAKEIENLKAMNYELQNVQSKLIDETLASTTKKDVELMKEQLEKLADENKIIKEQCQHVESQLDIALLQLQDSQQRQMNNDMEINLLRHQVLDLQSTGDNKAIVARLSGEVLVAHLQATESHKKIERLNASLNKEKQLRIEAEEMLSARQKIFDVYAFRYDSKFRYMYNVMLVLRQQYQGSLPTIAINSFLNNIEEYNRKTHEVNKKLDEIEELRSNLMTKHSVFDQILDISKNKCIDDEDNCHHKLRNIVLQGTHSRDLEHWKNKLQILENSRHELLNQYSSLEKTLILLNQGFLISEFKDKRHKKVSSEDEHAIKIEDVKSDDESSPKGDGTVSLTKPQVLPPSKGNIDMTKIQKEETAKVLFGSPIKTDQEKKSKLVSVHVQTKNGCAYKEIKSVQTDIAQYANEDVLMNLKKELENKNVQLTEVTNIVQNLKKELWFSNQDKINAEATIQSTKNSNLDKDRLNESLRADVDNLRKQIDYYKHANALENTKMEKIAHEENKKLLDVLSKFESDKNAIVTEYKDLLNKERDQYSKSMKDLQTKILGLESQVMDRKEGDTENTSQVVRGTISKNTFKIAELEDQCFKYQSALDECKTEVITYQSEVDRWKFLANERLNKMEQMSSQLQERHYHEVESYKAENEHWLSQLNQTHREHQELRSRLTEQKAAYVKQLADKDALIEQLRSAVHGLKTQMMSMQTMISVTDPSFDLSAIVEVDEASDLMSQQDSERLELKFDSSGDLHDSHDDKRVAASSTSVWQEPALERLRREKQLTAKQNALLRRQIKALAARERRARLDAQNLRNQIFRISTSGHKVVTAETAALHNKIASLQAQLNTARKDSHSTVALWDKWKRAQQASERWQLRYSEKCEEVKKLEAQLNLARSAVARLEREKRLLLSRLADAKDKELELIEKQDAEKSEKMLSPIRTSSPYSEPPVSSRALLDRVEAQQRRIAALEVADRGNEHLVSEYEKSLAEITSLKGQVLKLESTLLESQIKVAETSHTKSDQQPELEYWKSYCEMLKEENVQLNLRVNALETTPTTANQHRINDLEQTVLTLRGLVSKLQADQKSGVTHKRPDSRPSSGRSASISDKTRTQLESYRIEIANLKRSIQDKDLLLERSKEMLKIAAEREDELLRENSALRRQLVELRTKRGFSSA